MGDLKGSHGHTLGRLGVATRVVLTVGTLASLQSEEYGMGVDEVIPEAKASLQVESLVQMESPYEGVEQPMTLVALQTKARARVLELLAKNNGDTDKCVKNVERDQKQLQKWADGDKKSEDNVEGKEKAEKKKKKPPPPPPENKKEKAEKENAGKAKAEKDKKDKDDKERGTKEQSAKENKEKGDKK